MEAGRRGAVAAGRLSGLLLPALTCCCSASALEPGVARSASFASTKTTTCRLRTNASRACTNEKYIYSDRLAGERDRGGNPSRPLALTDSVLSGMDGGEPSTKTRPVKRRIGKPRPEYLRRLKELEKSFKGMEERYNRENGIQRREEEKPPAEDQEILDYREQWERRYGSSFGSFDEETSLGPVYCATGTIPPDALPERSLQFFSIKITDLCYSLSWPLQVHGFVAARDSVDRKRNYLFRCTRDSCQILTRKDPFLRLTGPSRAVLLIDQVAIEVQIKVKGAKESEEDKVFVFKCLEFQQSCLLKDDTPTRIPGQRCSLDFALAVLPKSVEAIVGVQVIGGSWPDQCAGLIVCKTDNAKEGEVVLLLDFQAGKLPTRSDGVIELSRRLVSVGSPEGKLIISVEATRNRFSAKGTVEFGVETSGASTHTCDLVFCKMEVTVSWYLVSASRD